jgi:hypothetical protein
LIKKYSHKKDKPILVTFYYGDLINKQRLFNLILSKIEKGYYYLVLLKVKYNNNLYFMAGKQFAFIYDDNDNHYFKALDNLHSNVTSLIDKSFENYDITEEDIVYYQLSFTKIDSKFLTDISLDPKSLSF